MDLLYFNPIAAEIIYQTILNFDTMIWSFPTKELKTIDSALLEDEGYASLNQVPSQQLGK